MKDRAAIRERYLKLREAYGIMVGNLYPSIAYEELMQLRAQYVEGLEGPDGYWGDLPTVPPPRADGRSPGVW